MFKVIIYEDRQGRSTVKEYIKELEKKAQTSKDERVRLRKIMEYIAILRQYGTRIGQPMVKHIDGDIWELRPTSDRIFFFFWKDDTFVLLHHFVKKTNKTPAREIEQAKRNLNDFIERSK
jgi:phage-related protein